MDAKVVFLVAFVIFVVISVLATIWVMHHTRQVVTRHHDALDEEREAGRDGNTDPGPEPSDSGSGPGGDV